MGGERGHFNENEGNLIKFNKMEQNSPFLIKYRYFNKNGPVRPPWCPTLVKASEMKVFLRSPAPPKAENGTLAEFT